MTPEEFNSRFLPYAQAVSARTGLDPRLVLAQAALETGYGKSAPNMNYFGIKSHGRAGGQTLQTSEFENGRMVSQPASFRGYDSPEQSFQGYADFLLTNPRYKGVLAADGLENQIAAMAKSGYATDPNYGAKLASIAGVAGGNDMLTGGGGSMSLLGGGNDTGGGPAMENEQGGLFGFLGDREQRARLGLALMGMSMHPNEGAMALMRDTIAQAQAARENQFAQAQTDQQTNRTVEYIRNLNTPQANEALNYFYGTGDITKALDIARQTAEPERGVVVGGSIVNPLTGEVIYQSPDQVDPMDAIELEKARIELERLKYPPPAPAFTDEQFGNINTLRDDVRTDLSTFEVVKQGYNNIVTFYSNPSGTSDYALAVAFAKILDPGSVAREGEVSAVQSAGAKVPALGQALKNAITGEGALTPQVRQEIAENATRIYAERAAEAQQRLDGYGKLADQMGIPRQYIYGGEIPAVQPIIPSIVPPSAAAVGVMQEDWNVMTQDERRAFMEAN